MNSEAMVIPAAARTEPREERTPRYLLLEGVLLILGLLGMAFVNYNTPNAVSVAIQAIILALFFRSKTNFPWLFMMFFIAFTPGGLFSNQAKQLILIDSSALGVVSFEMMFVLVAWLKILKERKVPVFYQRRFIPVALYIGLLVVVFGTRWVTMTRAMIFFSWLLVIPRLLHSQKEIDRLFYLIFLANIFVFLANIYKVSTGHQILSLFTQEFTIKSPYSQSAIIRTAEAIQFAHIAVVGGLYYLSKERSAITPLLAYSGLVLGLINIISSATRGWIISSVFLIFAYSFFMLPRLFRNIIIVIPVVAITVAVVWQVPVIRTQVIKAYERTLYFENILNPDLNEETTDIGRVMRGAHVMEKYKESPWVGFGFSEEVRGYADLHTGNQSILLNMGIFGYLLLLYFWTGFLYALLTADSFFRPQTSDYRLNILVVFAFISVFLIHSTSGAFLHPYLGTGATLWYGTIFAMGNYLYYRKKNILV